MTVSVHTAAAVTGTVKPARIITEKTAPAPTAEKPAMKKTAGSRKF